MLAELTELGMDLARALHRRAMAAMTEAPAEAPAGPPAAQAPEPAPDPALQFARVARAVRQTIALEAHLVENRDKGREQRRAAQAEAAAKATEHHKIRIEHGVRRAVRISGEQPRSSWLADLRNLLERDAEDLNQLPLAEAIARICRLLGINAAAAAALSGADWTGGEPAKTPGGKKKPVPPPPAAKGPRRPSYLAPPPGPTLAELVMGEPRAPSSRGPP